MLICWHAHFGTGARSASKGTWCAALKYLFEYISVLIWGFEVDDKKEPMSPTSEAVPGCWLHLKDQPLHVVRRKRKWWKKARARQRCSMFDANCSAALCTRLCDRRRPRFCRNMSHAQNFCLEAVQLAAMLDLTGWPGDGSPDAHAGAVPCCQRPKEIDDGYEGGMKKMKKCLRCEIVFMLFFAFACAYMHAYQACWFANFERVVFNQWPNFKFYRISSIVF